MGELVDDGDGRTVSLECVYFCAPSTPAWCNNSGCQCVCHAEPQCPCEARGSDHPGDCIGPSCPLDPPLVGNFRVGASEVSERARELDDRPPNKLATIAADMEAEARPDVAELMAERYGRPRRGAA